MKRLNVLVLVLVVVFFNSCKPDSEIKPDPDATVLFQFTHQVKGQPLLRSTSLHTNATGNSYKVDLLKYYVTNITLVDEKGFATNYKNYNLIDAFNIGTTSFLLDKKIPNGNYRKLVFSVGVDQELNHTGAQEGALSAANGMLWDWTFGYIFYKIEGRFTSTTVTSETQFRNHLGTDSALAIVEIPILMDIKGVERKVNITLDIDKTFGTGANSIDLTVDKDRQSNLGDEGWMLKLKQNLSNAFTVTSIE